MNSQEINLILKHSHNNSKYGAKKTSFKGRNYDSQAEANRASELDLMVSSKQIFFWIPQPMFLLVEGFTYRPDFLVVGYDHKNLQITWVEDVKGAETQRFRDAKRLWQVHGKIPLHVLKRKGKRWNTEVVNLIK
jgi:hypothetical protein